MSVVVGPRVPALARIGLSGSSVRAPGPDRRRGRGAAALGFAGRLVLRLFRTTAPDRRALLGVLLARPRVASAALSALVSNFWLGQGPWTPWQMAGWGMVGVAGAVVAAGTGRRLNRWGLAAVAALMGFAYGALLDLSVMVSYGGEQSLDRYLALSARGIPFNAAHAAGNFVLMLAAGPAKRGYNPDSRGVVELIRELTNRPPVSELSVEKPGLKVTLRSKAAN